MKYGDKNRGWRKVLSVTVLTVVSVGVAGLTPVFATPPDHAPAYGYRRKQEKKHEKRDWSEKRRHDREDGDEDWKDREKRDAREAEWIAHHGTHAGYPRPA